MLNYWKLFPFTLYPLNPWFGLLLCELLHQCGMAWRRTFSWHYFMILYEVRVWAVCWSWISVKSWSLTQELNLSKTTHIKSRGWHGTKNDHKLWKLRSRLQLMRINFASTLPPGYGILISKFPSEVMIFVTMGQQSTWRFLPSPSRRLLMISGVVSRKTNATNIAQVLETSQWWLLNGFASQFCCSSPSCLPTLCATQFSSTKLPIITQHSVNRQLLQLWAFVSDCLQSNSVVNRLQTITWPLNNIPAMVFFFYWLQYSVLDEGKTILSFSLTESWSTEQKQPQILTCLSLL